MPEVDRPFEALLVPPTPMEPDPGFAARLRARLERAFDLPKGATVSSLANLTPAVTVPTRQQATTPYLAIAGAEEAIRWYEEALGARLAGEPVVMADGRIGHAELVVAGGRLMLSEESPEIGVSAPAAGAGSAVTIHLDVDDVDALIDRAVAAGASLEREAADYPYGRNGVFRDPFGHRWLVSGETLVASGESQSGAHQLRHGDVGYASLWVGDAERAANFFSQVLGWSAEQSDDRWTWAVHGLSLPHGINPGHPEPTLYLCYAVGDIDSALEAVRAAGGTAEEPAGEPWGATAMCTDNQGLSFAVFEPAGGVAPAGSPPPAEGRLHGDLAYITMLVGDSASARQFYSTVFGWGFHPGHIDDGWGVEGTVPMTGMSGGNERSVVLPMYRVDDIAAAVARVRDAGGTATDPEARPYGMSSECTDDQGTHFYLGQL